MSRRIALVFAFILLALQAIAQKPEQTEIIDSINRAMELRQAERFADAAELFLEIRNITKDLPDSTMREVYFMSSLMASSCCAQMEDYLRGYEIANDLMGESLSDEERNLLYGQYVYNGYKHAYGLMLGGSNEDYVAARRILLDISPYAGNEFKNRILPMIPLTWYYEGLYHHGNEMYQDALTCYTNASSEYDKLGLRSGVSSSLKQIASIYSYLGESESAVSYYEQALSVGYEESCVVRMEIVMDLVEEYRQLGDMESAAKYDRQMDTLFTSTDDLEARCVYYGYKGDAAKMRKEYRIAEQWYVKALDAAEEMTIDGEKHSRYRLCRFDLGTFYHAVGRYDDALYCLNDSFEKETDIERDYLSYILIADILLKKGDGKGAEAVLDTLSRLEPVIDEPRQLSKIHILRGDLDLLNKDYQSALEDYLKADAIMAAKYPAGDEERAMLFARIGGVEHKLGNYIESEKYYDLYAGAISGIYGERSLAGIKAVITLANAQGFAGNVKDGCTGYVSAAENLRDIIRNRLPYMTASERESFWEPLSSLFRLMTPYALKAGMCHDRFTKACYDALVLSKAFLLDSERSLYGLIQSDSDVSAMQVYKRVSSLKSKIAEWEKNYGTYADSILVASEIVSKLETAMMDKSRGLGDMSSFVDIDYKSVKYSLKRDEILVDFTDFVLDNGVREYAAYIINRKQRYPLLVKLFSEPQVRALGIVYPDMYYQSEYASEVLELLWNPIKDFVDEGATVYYVPSQMLFQVSLESLPLEDGTLLGEHYKFVRLSSARELTKKQSPIDGNGSAVLYGGLQYDLLPELMIDNAKRYELTALTRSLGRGMVQGDIAFDHLSGTKDEVEAISGILKAEGFVVSQRIGKEGSEESFLSLHRNSPRVLHMATHGFYYSPDEATAVDYLKGYSDAMSLSGLVMSGGNAGWLGKEIPDGVLGGILTANDISQLDLSGTDLVVLSACKTGQGAVTPEGLYGLQRAFKKAGANTIVMSLWDVSDVVAKEFMVRFYQALIETKWDKRSAFQTAKSYIRNANPDEPYLWAAFVMLD